MSATAVAPAVDAPAPGAARRPVAAAAVLLALALGGACLVSLGTGALRIPVADVAMGLARASGLAAALGWPAPADPAAAARDVLVIAGVRLPRVLLGAGVGALLALAGALMQGLFRNPLAEPGLVGVSAGAGLAAAVTIVLGERLLGTAPPFAALPAGAFLGGLATTLLLYTLATKAGRTSVATLLLAGVALGALAGAATGVLVFFSDDRQLRDLTFWSLGSLAGATWTKVATLAPALGLALLIAPRLARGLNALSLGEAEAFHLGVSVERVKAGAVALTALAVGVAVAAAGVVGFVGIVVPHLVRLAVGPDHRALLPLSALGGALLVVAADAMARVAVAPAELPLGVLTAALGAPVFLRLLLKGRAAA